MGLLAERAEKRGEPVEPGLPEIDAGQYLIDAMMALGPTRSNGMGEEPTDWHIIAPFVQATGRLSEPWELETLADMCRAYLTGRNEGDNPLCIPPVERG